MIIRPESATDITGIHDLVTHAFDGHPHSDGSEPHIIDRLRAAEALTLSLVAEDQGTLVGHIAFSPVTLNGKQTGWYGLGPVSTLPERQGQGIGSTLIRKGLEELEQAGARGLVLLGDPAFYQRFGFQHSTRVTCPGLPAEYFMVLPMADGNQDAGEIAYHPAFFG